MSAILSALFNTTENTIVEPELSKNPIDYFKLPIDYLDKSKVHTLSPIVAADLELDTTIYNEFLQPKTEYDSDLLKQIKTQYTSDVNYLQDSQILLLSYQNDDKQNVDAKHVDAKHLSEIWNDVYVLDKFHERNGFLDIKQLKSVNKMETFMGYWTIMNLISPVFSILLPFMFLLAPFIILRIRHVPISLSTYLDLLKDLAKSHAIGKTLTSMENFSFNNFIYIVFTLGVYGLQMYQNCCHCTRFYHGISTVNNNLLCLQKFVNNSISNIELFLKRSFDLPSYTEFNTVLKTKLKTLYVMRDNLADVKPFETGVFNMFKKCFEVGYLLKTYYCFHDSVEFRDALGYSIGFESYKSGLDSIAYNMLENRVNVCVFENKTDSEETDSEESDSEKSDKSLDKHKSDSENTDSEESDKDKSDSENTDKSDKSLDTDSKKSIKKTKSEIYTAFINQVYPPHANNSNIVANTMSLKKNVVITGPNASGKTTQLKTTAINIILTQQYGVGYYQTGKLVPYTHIHSYLNIPDTSGRDSLFQAEARRCKDIIDIISDSDSEESKSRHFCIFDELFSGTNADEATGASFGFLKYLQSYKNVDFILTTHFVNLCKKINAAKDLRIVNYKMDAELVGETDIKFSYKLVEGISKIKAARLILIQMGFPDEIVEAI